MKESTHIDIKRLLSSNNKSEIVSAVKLLRKNKSENHCNDLYEVFEKIKNDSTYWDCQTEIIKSAGMLNCRQFMDVLQKKCSDNLDHDMITIVSAEALVRMERESINDVRIILELLKTGNYSVITGAFNALGKDKMLPQRDDILKLIDFAQTKDFDNVNKGYGDPYLGLVVAASGWEKAITKDFLLLKTKSTWSTMAVAAEKALLGKYFSNWE